jgi:hypothetical protein
MPAYVKERVYFSGRSAQHDDTFVTDFAQEVIAGIGNKAGAPGTDPPVEVEAFHLFAEDFRIGVIARRQGHGDGCSAHSYDLDQVMECSIIDERWPLLCGF